MCMIARTAHVLQIASVCRAPLRQEDRRSIPEPRGIFTFAGIINYLAYHRPF